MARFYGYASLKGFKAKQKVRELGVTAIEAHVRSWDHGITVEYKAYGNNAVCEVWETGGSNNPVKTKLLKRYKLKNISTRKPGPAGSGGIGNEVSA